ncbi:MAG: membrane dipeptidase [Blastocatellia bacterium]|nr:membrane dipeptidase [Blastocatellia bacterium]MCS7158255.1 membrane dipeptidase [Blastocatellia bacterium]MCX7753093.1 membrane dipeptidase [Blastocatellia bacterium]MDW8169408.1 membrane dipeptidase [Acidobacteriota bacterium]MDW8256476.1 membrane dipeptidase [Acidobacteriota bacterium]
MGNKIAGILFLTLFVLGTMLPPTHSSQRSPSDDKLWAEALRIHREAIVVDTHSDVTSRMLDEGFDIGRRASDGHMDIPRMKEGGIDAQFFAIYVAARYAREGGAARRALDMIDVVYRALERYPNELELALSSEDIRRIARAGKIAVLMGIEGGHAIEDSLGALRMFYRLGVRYMTLTHTNTNNWADSSGDEPRHNGLTEFGRQVVREMNRLGMLVDISHVSDKTFYDVLETTRAPVIASHSSARALTNIPRNMSDDMLRALARNGGVVMVAFGSFFVDQSYAEALAQRRERLRPQLEALRARYANDPVRLRQETERLFREHPIPRPPLSRLIDHIDHIAKVAGIDHVGLGSDFDGVDSLPEGLDDCSKLPLITYELLKRGYSERDIKKILGENFLRVFARAEEVARQMQRESQ